jgi:hypothetical protein
MKNISIVKPTRCTIFPGYWIPLYMFWTVFPSIIRSSRPYIQRQVYVIQVSLTACWQEFIEYHSNCFERSFLPSSGVQDRTYSVRYMSYVFRWLLASKNLLNTTLHVSNGLSVHQQEFKTVHTASSICHRVFVDCLLASSQRTCMTYTWCCMYSLELLMMDGMTFRNM